MQIKDGSKAKFWVRVFLSVAVLAIGTAIFFKYDSDPTLQIVGSNMITNTLAIWLSTGKASIKGKKEEEEQLARLLNMMEKGTLTLTNAKGTDAQLISMGADIARGVGHVAREVANDAVGDAGVIGIEDNIIPLNSGDSHSKNAKKKKK